ncbi:MAG: hypothetical protein LBT13_00100 [Treponema sp.]|jgi:phosphoribosyl 1,2-cyclic phosphate phosphodiesterase|nr:hypothetical protein [Treponema sp.]
MKLKYYGTAAAEGFPAMFCECQHCKQAWSAGGKNIRTRSQALVDGILLIDFPADTLAHIFYGGLPLTKIHDCIITHTHQDHYYPEDLANRQNGYAFGERPELGEENTVEQDNSTVPDTLGTLTVHGSYAVGELFTPINQNNQLYIKSRVVFREVSAFMPFAAAGFLVTPLLAQHPSCPSPFIYLIEKEGETILYGNDTGWYPNETWDYLEKTRPHIRIASFDCTDGLADSRTGHMGLPCVIETRNRLIELGCIDSGTICIIHHFSHTGRLTYDEIKPLAEKNGFAVSYDGMEVSSI